MTKRRDFTECERQSMIDTCAAVLKEFDDTVQEFINNRPTVEKLQKLRNKDFRHVKLQFLVTEKRIAALRRNINEIWKLNNIKHESS